jgi:aminobenzoyl-glutamate transport protein
MDNNRKEKRGLFTKALDTIEIVGNRLPHPATIFAMLALLVVVISWIGYTLNMQATHPVNGNVIEAQNLLSADGLRWMYSNLLDNFLKFPPLGYVLVVMVGIGVAEGSGLFTLMIRALVLKSPPRLITAAVVTAGIISHLASEAGYMWCLSLWEPLSFMLWGDIPWQASPPLL